MGICAFTLENKYYLVVEDFSSNKINSFYLKDKEFVLGYTHSVMKTLCEEFFQVDEKNSLILTKTIYESYGAGLPFLSSSENEGSYELVDSKLVLIMDREFKELNMFVSFIPNHYIRINENLIYFQQFLPKDNSKVRIYVRKGIF